MKISDSYDNDDKTSDTSNEVNNTNVDGVETNEIKFSSDKGITENSLSKINDNDKNVNIDNNSSEDENCECEDETKDETKKENKSESEVSRFGFVMPGVFDFSGLSEVLPEEFMNFFENFKDLAIGGMPIQSQPVMNSVDDSKDGDGKNKGAKTKNKFFQQRARKKSYLDQYCVNLNSMAKDEKIDRIIGRTSELDRVVRILNRRNKNNPVLIGEPGVGKTAIAEGLAVKIVKGEVPYKLLSTEIYLLDLTSVVAGAQYRGQFEDRMKRILEEVESRGNVILVIDELHKIVGTGEPENPMNAANIIKPALAKGYVKIIGATTLDEYRKYIEKDSALERRFQPIIVDEPTCEEAISIISNIKDYYENFHCVKISDKVIKFAVDISKKYISDRFLPDKAIDLIDEASSVVNLNNKVINQLMRLKTELAEIQRQKTTAVSADSIEEYKKAASLKTAECRVNQEIAKLESQGVELEVCEEDIANVVQSWTKIPMNKITQLEANKLQDLENNIKNKLIGQDEAIRGVANAIRIHRTGVSLKKSPSSFMLVGPSGVGKTELARILSKELFTGEDSLIRLDMSEYMEKHSVSKIIGAPPGYIGYDEAGQLTEKVRRKPYSLILFDEIEKAHTDVVNILLQILEDGRITDSRGRVVNFENTVIIMTSNAGSNFKSGMLGFSSDNNKSIKDNVNSALKEIFKPEFINRIDEIAIFNSLSKQNLIQISEILLRNLKQVLSGKNIELIFTPKIVEYIAENGYDIKYGARPMYRLIKKEIESEIARLIIDGTLQPGNKVNIDYLDEQKKICVSLVQVIKSTVSRKLTKKVVESCTLK